MEMHILSKRVYYHDTDCGNVVYYANYLKYLEEARTEYFRDKGVELKKLADLGTFFVVSSVDIQYKNSARYADNLLISSQIEKKKTASIDFYHEIKRDATLLVTCRTKLVCVGMDFKPKPIPENITI